VKYYFVFTPKSSNRIAGQEQVVKGRAETESVRSGGGRVSGAGPGQWPPDPLFSIEGTAH